MAIQPEEGQSQSCMGFREFIVGAYQGGDIADYETVAKTIAKLQ